MFLAVLLCFLLSGFAALIYETAWLRQFSIVFGTSELAVATILAAYMAGLAAGSAAAARWVPRVKRPVLVYGLLELGIGLSALAVPWALRLAASVHAALLGGHDVPPDSGGLGTSLFYLFAAFPILLVPTGLMGATLPLLARHAVQREEQIGRRIGVLYGTNTLGAVLGTLVGAFLLLPRLGLFGLLLVGAGVNVLVFLLAVGISRSAGTAVAEEAPSTPAPGAGTGAVPRVFRLVLPLMLLSGAASFTYEVLWTRLLGHLLGASVYAFATMLASFLAGITGGSLIASRFARTRRGSTTGLAVVQFGTALLSIGVYLSLGGIPGLARSLGVGEEGGLLANATVAALVLLPSTLCIGATFPFAVRMLAADEDDAARSSARVYAWNTVGAIAGAVLAGFVVLPGIGFQGTILVAAGTNLLLGLACLRIGGHALPRIAAGAVAAAALLALFRPERPDELLRSSPLSWMTAEGEVVYYDVGRSATVLLLDQGGSYQLRTNGLPEAAISVRGSVPGTQWERWLCALPILLRPSVEDVLVVGLGGGVTVERVPATVRTLDVIELEPAVVTANRMVAEQRLADPLSDRRLRLVVNDARSALARTDRRYDAIISQPSHPWTAGASNLFTREFAQLVREHLEPGGVFLQWMGLAYVDDALLATLVATLLDTYEHAQAYRPTGSMILLVASDEPLELPRDLSSGPLARASHQLVHLGLLSPADVVATLVGDDESLRALAADAPVNTDDRNFLSTRSSRAIGRPDGMESIETLLAAHDPLVRPGGPLVQGAARPSRVVARMAQLGNFRRAERVAAAVPAGPERELALSYVLWQQGRRPEANLALKRSLSLAPDDADARFTSVYRELDQKLQGGGDVGAGDDLEGTAAAVTEGFRRLHRGDWSGLRELEPTLGRVDPAALWYPEACELRATWRTRSGGGRAHGEEALRIVDQLLAHRLARIYAHYLVIRADAAGQADRPLAVLETARSWIDTLRKLAGAGASPDYLQSLMPNTVRLLEAVRALASDPRVDPKRVQEVVGQLSSLV